jgi:hypothetical protein
MPVRLMNFDDIYLVSHKRTATDEAGLATLTESKDYAFPEDVVSFLRRFGAGEYCGCVGIFKPADLLSGQETFRNAFRDGFYYDLKKSALSQKEALQATWVARRLDGDEVVYQSSSKTGFYVLPRHVIIKIGASLAEALEWFRSSGVIYEPTKNKWFCTYQDRCRLHLTTDDEIDHATALNLLDKTFGVDMTDQDSEQQSSTLFCRKISGLVYVYGNSMDIHHDLDFDANVVQTAETKFCPLGFRAVEHFRP